MKTLGVISFWEGGRRGRDLTLVGVNLYNLDNATQLSLIPLRPHYLGPAVRPAIHDLWAVIVPCVTLYTGEV